MSALRSVIVHIDASPRSEKRLLLARDMAALHDAHLTALYANTPSILCVPFALSDGTAEMLPMLQELDRERHDDARALFDRSVSTGTHAVKWHELHGEAVIPALVLRALFCDLLVLGQHDQTDPLTLGVPSDFVESVLIGSGKPALIVPYTDIRTMPGKRVMIAWKPTRESAHAVCASMPLLRRALHIDLVCEALATGAHEAHALESYLREQGVEAAIEWHASIDANVPGESLLSLAADLGSDLLVMGCYGHSRARELVMGGASRTVLASMTIPVLMAH